jgi:hypothetical protein
MVKDPTGTFLPVEGVLPAGQLFGLGDCSILGKGAVSLLLR